MFTVNLERQLIKQNKKILLPNELLNLQEYERLGDDFCESEVLTRLGINTTAVRGRNIKNETIEQERKISKYDKERVFHISQIESVCKKYHLRFLRAEHFRGAFDKELASKISNFEIANNVILEKHNCNIAAPSSSFELEKNPKDPLFFYRISEDYWYLIHKWGNDLSFLRTLYRVFSLRIVSFLILFIVPVCIIWGLAIKFQNGVLGVVAAVCSVLAVSLMAFDFVERDKIRLVKPNEWDSSFI